MLFLEVIKYWLQKIEVRPHWQALALQSEYVELVAVNDSFITTEYMVTLDLAKGVYAKFIDWDEQMFDQETCTPAHSAKRCWMSDTLYGENNGDALKDARFLDAVSRNDPDIVKFLMVMALCSTVVPIKSNDGTITYQAQSQDEEALVTAASKLNMVLVSKDSNTAEISFNGCKFYYDLLDILEFTSDRKRMSAVVKDVQSGKILFLSKGADEAILPRCHQAGDGSWCSRSLILLLS
ncbi:phospholipid-transporting ATPase 2-like isoform X3 [Oryza sativa Japonica Group]|uniref:phospholipid-transporting ATPase 2-like isoform X3 n=1 Tax=Oryza sativa subsp. japonica TaxID=39947 RepID=UPI00339CD1F2